MAKADSEIWRTLKPHRGKTRSNGLSGKKRRYYQWDFTHGEIEVYDYRGRHLGAMDASTGLMTKPPVEDRTIEI